MGDMEAKLLAKNKKAYFDYHVLEKYETGIVLTGPEVKSIKCGQVQLKGSFARINKGRVIVENMHISPYAPARNIPLDPLRQRELLLKRMEIDHLTGLTAQKGFTLVPLEVIQKGRLVKIILGVCRGKHAGDKRDVLKHRAMEKEIQQGLRDLKKFSR